MHRCIASGRRRRGHRCVLRAIPTAARLLKARPKLKVERRWRHGARRAATRGVRPERATAHARLTLGSRPALGCACALAPRRVAGMVAGAGVRSVRSYCGARRARRPAPGGHAALATRRLGSGYNATHLVGRRPAAPPRAVVAKPLILHPYHYCTTSRMDGFLHTLPWSKTRNPRCNDKNTRSHHSELLQRGLDLRSRVDGPRA